MNNNILDIREFAESHAAELVKAIAVAEKMGMLNTEADLISITTAGIETAIEDYYQKLENLKK
jgi:hypothetical protein